MNDNESRHEQRHVAMVAMAVLRGLVSGLTRLVLERVIGL
jgi:hypothetical protein